MPRIETNFTPQDLARLQSLTAQSDAPADRVQGLIFQALNAFYGFDPPLVQRRRGERKSPAGQTLKLTPAGIEARRQNAAKARAARKAKREKAK